MLAVRHHPSPAAIANAMLRYQDALELGERLAPARTSTAAAAALIGLASVTSIKDFCGDSPACVYQREFQGREPYLLRADSADPYGFTLAAVHDHRPLPAPCGRYWLEVTAGLVLVPADTLVYWR